MGGGAFMDEYPSVAIARLREMISRYGSGVLRRMDRCSSGEALLLKLLVLNDGPIHPSELRQRTCISSARVAAILNTLEKKGLIVRAIDRQDRRRILVTITDEGRERAEREIAEIETELAAVFRELGQKDTEEFLRLLARLFDVFIRMKDEPAC
jgi:DNA-binding MarR family transcriptional regulator